MMSLRIDRTDTRTAYDAAYAAAYAAYRDAVLVRGRAVVDAVAHNHDPVSAAAATQAIIAACHAARAVEAAAFAVLAEAVEDNLVAIYDSTIHAQMTPPRTAPKTTIRAEWFADGTPATCTCGRSPDCDHVRNAQALGTVRGSVSAVWEEMK